MANHTVGLRTASHIGDMSWHSCNKYIRFCSKGHMVVTQGQDIFSRSNFCNSTGKVFCNNAMYVTMCTINAMTHIDDALVLPLFDHKCVLTFLLE